MTTLFRTSSNEGTELDGALQQRFKDVKLTISNAAASAGRDGSSVTLVAVSKTVGAAEVQAALEAGQRDFGENRAPLIKERLEGFPNARWHFIGRIQTNKLKEYVGRAALIHSVASVHALQAISTLAVRQNLTQAVLLQVNTSGEASKDGVAPAALPGLLEQAALLEGIYVKGLMTMAPLAASPEDGTARRCFAALRALRDNLAPVWRTEGSICLDELSMGMTNDFEDAIKEGATIVRIGRRLWS